MLEDRLKNTVLMSSYTLQVLCQGQTASYMWEVGVDELDDENPLRLEFSVTFHLEATDSPVRNDIDNKDTSYLELYKYYACLQRFKVFFLV